MKTLNDKRLEIASKTREKQKRIKENRDRLNNNDHWTMEYSWNEYIKKFWTNWGWNWKRDRVLVDANWYVNRIRADNETEKDYILDNNTSFMIYHEKDFFEKTEKLFNS